MKVMVSACLIGDNCKYSGGNNLNEKVMKFIEDKEVIPICPEVMGGLSIPRKPAEIKDGEVINSDGESVDMEFRLGAEMCLNLAKAEFPFLVILQPRSPSCGVHQVYDGSFSGKLVDGMGVCAELLTENGFMVVEPDELE